MLYTWQFFFRSQERVIIWWQVYPANVVDIVLRVKYIPCNIRKLVCNV